MRTPATMITYTETALYFACPYCGAKDQHQVGHLVSNVKPVSIHNWQCSECGWLVSGEFDPASSVFYVTNIKECQKSMKGFMLLRLAPSKVDSPVWFVVEETLQFEYGPDDIAEKINTLKRIVEEHSCPVNYVRFEAIISDHDEDPHGIFQFVDFKVPPADWDTNTCVWGELFPQIGSVAIDIAVSRNLSVLTDTIMKETPSNTKSSTDRRDLTISTPIEDRTDPSLIKRWRTLLNNNPNPELTRAAIELSCATAIDNLILIGDGVYSRQDNPDDVHKIFHLMSELNSKDPAVKRKAIYKYTTYIESFINKGTESNVE